MEVTGFGIPACPDGGRRRWVLCGLRLGRIAFLTCLLLLPLLVCSGHRVLIQIGKYLMILSLFLLRVPFFDK
jgi:hypothetical protein